MVQTTYYKLLSQDQHEVRVDSVGRSLSETSDQSTSSDDSLDLALVEIGSKRPKAKRKVRRKRARRKMGNITNFDGATESYEELVGSAKKRRQFLILGGLFALAVIVIGAIVLSVYLVTGDDNYPEDDGKPIQLEDILKGTLSARKFNGTWIDDDSFHYFDNQGNFKIYNVKEKKSEIVIGRDQDPTSQLLTSSTFEFSYDKRYILMSAQIVKLFRHSSYATWNIYDTQTKSLIPVTVSGSARPLRLVKFSPVSYSLILVSQGNLFYKSSPTAPEVQITTDGTDTNGIFNGVPDWVYEEEIFSSPSASWFSPDGKKVAFIKFDDSKVHLMNLPVYGSPGTPEFQYPQTLSVHYPKAAVKNPEVSLHYIDLTLATDSASAQANLKEVPVPLRFTNLLKDHIISSVSWATNDDLIGVFMNRVQNQGDIVKCSTNGATPVCSDVHQLDIQGGWIEFFTAPFYNKGGSEIIFIASYEKYRHVISVNLNTGVAAARTSGKFVVNEILSVHKEHNLIIYLANTENDPKTNYIYAVKNILGAAPVCLTCGGQFEAYSYFSAEVSENGNNLVVISEGPAVPKAHLTTLSVTDAKIELTDLIELSSNEDLRRALEGLKVPKINYYVVELDNGAKSHVKMVVPSDMDPNVQHPTIVDVYGGPDSSSVTNRWSIDWGTYLVSAKNYIYVRIDGRGSGLKGDDVLFALYRKLGTVEVDDQIETMKKLQEQHEYIDKARTAIWGWSYGGYVSGMSLAKDTKNVFKCAVSVAPVTDWTLYDSIYTERYMGLPTASDNIASYQSSQLMKYIDNFKTNNKSYMLVHGTLDDNVHFQQGMLLARALERNDIMFQEITYPDEDHSLIGVRPHLYHSLERFFNECFQ